MPRVSRRGPNSKSSSRAEIWSCARRARFRGTRSANWWLKWIGSGRLTNLNLSIGVRTGGRKSSMTNTHARHSLPRAGDLVWADLRPTRGREQSGERPVLVVSDVEFHRRSRLAIVCPITSNPRPWPTKVPLPEGLAAAGSILIDQIRALDRTQRGFRRIGEIPDEVLADVRAKLAALIGIDPAAIAGWQTRASD